jgi:hypothetical protein
MGRHTTLTLPHHVGFAAAVCCLQGMRKRVGFQYNADEDTVEDVTMEMLENLSLMPQQVGGGQRHQHLPAPPAAGLMIHGSTVAQQLSCAGLHRR